MVGGCKDRESLFRVLKHQVKKIFRKKKMPCIFYHRVRYKHNKLMSYT